MVGIFDVGRGGGERCRGQVFNRFVTAAVVEGDGIKGVIRAFRCRFPSIDGRREIGGANLLVKGRERDVSEWGRGSSWSM